MRKTKSSNKQRLAHNKWNVVQNFIAKLKTDIDNILKEFE